MGFVFAGQELFPEQCRKSTGLPPVRGWKPEVLEDLEFTKCTLLGFSVVTFGSPDERTVIRNVKLRKCKLYGFMGIGALLEEVHVDGLQNGQTPVFLWGCALRHVTIRGAFGTLLINPGITPTDPRRNELFSQANMRYYESVDWALDITEARASCIEIRGSIPSHLVRRNPEDQFILGRDAANSGEWRNVPGWEEAAFHVRVSTFLDSGADSTVVVVGKRSKHYRQDLEFMQRLKAAGLVS
jgi:hypothetical protein